jgi:hypothetical protein
VLNELRRIGIHKHGRRVFGRQGGKQTRIAIDVCWDNQEARRLALFQNPVSRDSFSLSWHKLGSDLFSSPRALRQFRSDDFRRAGKNNCAPKTQSL